MKIRDQLTVDHIKELALPANVRYGEAIYRRSAVEMIESRESYFEGWVGGLDDSVADGGGSRRRTTIWIDKGQLIWHCSGNPKTHPIFCKHCVALALAINNA